MSIIEIDKAHFKKGEIDMKGINKADAWAADVWTKIVSNWENRSQDFNYRQLLARPGVRDAIKLLDPIEEGIFLDLGCGDGSEMRYMRKFLSCHGCSGIFFGFDFQSSLIAIAKRKNHTTKPIRMIFDSGHLASLVDKYGLENKVDVVFSTFLLQELSDAGRYFRMSANCLKKSGQGIFIFSHPKFGEAMLKKEAVRLNKKLKSKAWRWAAEFPIVEEGGKTFYVPYFQRELIDYLALAKKYFSTVDFYERKPSIEIVCKCACEKLSPFYDHPGNVYYPEIVEIPSALIFVVRK